MLFKYLAVALAPLIVSAVPVRRANATLDPGTLQVVQFADTLEKLETGFYQAVLAKFKAADFTAAGFKDGALVTTELAAMEGEEATHATTLEGLINAAGQAPLLCQFKLDSLLTNATTAVQSARFLEQVGVGAYLGALNLIKDPGVLTAAGSIATIESRHQAVTNIFSGQSPLPQPFDLPLLPGEVVGMAASLISGCNLNIQPNPPLAITNPGVITNGTTLQFSSPALGNDISKLYCQQINGNSNSATVLPANQCVVSSSANGPNLVYVTNTSQPLSGNIQVRQGQGNIITAGPTMYFADETPDPIGKLVVSTPQ